MSLRVVRLGSPRTGDALRIGTVRRPPRGVRTERLAADDWYDLWLPQLAPSPELVAIGRAAASASDWRTFARRYRAEMTAADNGRLVGLLAALSHRLDLEVGCYCEDEARCHRSVLRELLVEQGAAMEGASPR